MPLNTFEKTHKLGAICVLACVSHREHTGAGMAQFEILIGETVAINGFSASAVSLCYESLR